MKKIDIYCPECAKKGIRKKLLEADSRACGVIYPFCKRCHKNVTVILRVPQCHVKRNV